MLPCSRCMGALSSSCTLYPVTSSLVLGRLTVRPNAVATSMYSARACSAPVRVVASRAASSANWHSFRRHPSAFRVDLLNTSSLYFRYPSSSSTLADHHSRVEENRCHSASLSQAVLHRDLLECLSAHAYLSLHALVE